MGRETKTNDSIEYGMTVSLLVAVFTALYMWSSIAMYARDPLIIVVTFALFVIMTLGSFHLIVQEIK